MQRVLLATGLLLACVFGGGCSHYRLGTGSRPAFTSLRIEPVANRTALPQAEALVSARLREAFIRDGRVAIGSGGNVTLSVSLTDYRRDIAAVREGDTGLARKFNLTLSAAADRCDEYPEFIFTRGDAWLYRQAERLRPDLFAQIGRAHV